MTEIVLFHHVQGLTAGMVAFADELRAENHKVHTPDLFEGRTFQTLDEGMDHARTVGFGAILDRGVAAAEGLGPELVYIGFSMGVMPAQKLAQTRAGARGAVLIDACVPVSEFADQWPDAVPVQVHGMDHDPLFADEGDLDAARALVASTDQAELFLYPGNVHLFADSSLPSHDQAATELMTRRVLDFLSTID
ncbi:MAG TPA: dienelactone hydrolase family protein [Candidatus Limnocylindria bacterium]|nr:dienelactone hydrolase family protein [Candidatus Limnocylindria bacterium]